jgi:glycosyltransferase involved in cell wall biosynthesis
VLGVVVVLLLVAASLLVLVYQGVAIVFSYQMPELLPEPIAPSRGPRPTVSVVIAARDEGLDLPVTLDAVIAQDYPDLEIVVVEGGSSDGTRAAVLARSARVRLVDEPPLPPGWVGKSWACATGAAAARGEWLLFLDADVRLHPAAIRTLVDYTLRERADLASLAPRVEMVGFWERVVLPFMVQMILTYFRAPRVNRPDSRAALANGQCWLTSRSAYDRAGGHAAVRSRVLEDIAIARRYRAAGFTLRVAWSPRLAVTRMYRDRHEMFEGLLKNVHDTEFSAGRQLGLLVGLIALFWLPLAVLPVGLLTGTLLVTGVGAILWIALFGKHAAFARGVGGSAGAGLLFPVAVGFYVVLLATSLRRGLRGEPVAWKGRRYPTVRAGGPD